NNLRPGPYQVMLMRSDYLAKPRTLKLSADRTKTVELRASKSQQVTVRFIDKASGKPLRRVRPLFSSFDQSGKRLAPGLQVNEIPQPGVVEGVVPPNTHRLKIDLNVPEGYSVTPSEVEFGRDEFPEITVNAEVQESKEDVSPYQNVLLNLDESDQNGLTADDVIRAQVNFWNKESSVISYRETGGKELLDRTHNVKYG
ncbi:MAG: hypothetical protein ABEK50_05410, partial [bacterium]